MKKEPLSRKEQKTATRTALKEAARECFARSGYNGTQVSDITAAAGVAKGTFYVHYVDKNAVADELLADFNADLAMRMLPILQGGVFADLEPAIRNVAQVFLDYWSEHRGFVRAYAEKSMENLDLDQMQSGVNPAMQDAIGAALAQYAKENGFNVVAPQLVIQGLLSLWLRLGLQFLFNPAVTRSQVTETLVAMTTGALRGVLAGPQSTST